MYGAGAAWRRLFLPEAGAGAELVGARVMTCLLLTRPHGTLQLFCDLAVLLGP